MGNKYTKEIADSLYNKKESEIIKRMKLVDKLADGKTFDYENNKIINNNFKSKIKISYIVAIKTVFNKVKFGLSNNFKKFKIFLFKRRNSVNDKERFLSQFYNAVNYNTGKNRPIKLSIQDRINKIILKYKIILNIKYGWFKDRDNKVNYIPINNPKQQEFLNKLLSNKTRMRTLSNFESK